MFQFLAMTQAGCRRSSPRHLQHRITTLTFFTVVALVAEHIYPQTVNADSSDRPNIILIMVDDMGYSDLGCYGGETRTPNLDRLAAGGLRFTQFYNTGRCWPTRASLMTGLYPHQAGHAMMFGSSAPAGYRGTNRQKGLMISEVLGAQGYRTYHVGKWHLQSRSREAADTWPLGRGFDRSYCVRSQNNFFNPYVLTDEDKIVKRPGDDGDYYITRAFSDRAVDYLKHHAKEHEGKPFFLYLAHTAPHFPLHALQEDIDVYRDKFTQGWDVVRRQRLARQKKMGIVDCDLPPRDPVAKAWDDLTDAEQKMWSLRMAIHAAMIHRVDVGVGKVVKQLRKMNVLDDTLVLFLSDNGASAEYLVRGDGHDPKAPPGSGASYLCLEVGWSNAANTPFRQHKMWMHEGGIATPLIAHWPSGLKARGDITHQVGHVIDVMPTVLELAGARMPDEIDGTPAPKLPGHSLAPIFRGEDRKPPEFIFWEHVGNRAIRSGDWKLVAEHERPWELYDLKNDRSETKDRAKDRPDLVTKLSSLWQGYADKIGVVPWSELPQSKRKPSQEYRRK